METQPKLELTTQTFPGMAGEPMEILIYLNHGEKITRDEWLLLATEEEVKELNEYIQEISKSNHASAVRWVI